MKTEKEITFRIHTFIIRNKSHSYEKLIINASHRIDAINTQYFFH